MVSTLTIRKITKKEDERINDLKKIYNESTASKAIKKHLMEKSSKEES